MKIWEALIYGLVAGLTGLLPVSFSGHAAVLQDAFALSPLTQGGGLYVRAAITLGLSAALVLAFPGELQLTSLGQRAADSIAKFAGSWAFIFSFTGVLLAWMILNVLLAAKAFDPYPFILLNLVLSCVAAIQAPLIMMSQNRQEEKDRARAENDYKVNLKTEIMIEALHDKLNRILAREELLLQVQKEEHAPHYEKPEPKEN